MEDAPRRAKRAAKRAAKAAAAKDTPVAYSLCYRFFFVILGFRVA